MERNERNCVYWHDKSLIICILSLYNATLKHGMFNYKYFLKDLMLSYPPRKDNVILTQIVNLNEKTLDISLIVCSLTDVTPVFLPF